MFGNMLVSIPARAFMPIRGGSDVFSTERWKSTGTSLFTPVKQDIYVNVGKYDQISAAQGSFFTADLDGNYQNSVTGRLRPAVDFSGIRRKLYCLLYRSALLNLDLYVLASFK